ncbi:MAG: phosphatidate cytidylyltransferase [Actinomycetes bacterium]
MSADHTAPDPGGASTRGEDGLDHEVARTHASPLEPVPMEPVAPPERRGRAGRNLPAAVGVGAGLGAVILLSLYLWKPAFVGVVSVAIVLGLWELCNALGAARIRVPVVPVVIGAVAILVAAYAGGSEPMLVALALTVLGVFVWRLPESPTGFVRDVTAGTFAVLYVPFLAGFAVLLLRPDDGAGRVVVFILLTAFSDMGGYAAGVLFGRHPLAPTISPKKSWEGLGGSALFCAVGGALAVPLLLDGSRVEGLVVGLALMVTATVGDLGESVIKRDLGIKDMGALLPGHGGLMDRLDSLLPAAPVAYLLLAWFVPV